MRLAALFLLLAVGLASAAPTLQELTPGEKTAYIQLSEAPGTLTDNIYTVRQTVGSSTNFIESGTVSFAAGARTTTVTYTKNLSPGNYTFTLLLSGAVNNTTWTVSETKTFSIAAPAPTPVPKGNNVEIFLTAPSGRLDLSKDVTVKGTASHASGINRVWVAFINGGGRTCDENKLWEGPVKGKESWSHEWLLQTDRGFGVIWDPGKYAIHVRAEANDGTTGCVEVYPIPVSGEALNATPTPVPALPKVVDKNCDGDRCVISYDTTTNGSGCWETEDNKDPTCPIKGEVRVKGAVYEGRPTEPGKVWCVTINENPADPKTCTSVVAQTVSSFTPTGKGCFPAPYSDQYGNPVQTQALQRNNPSVTYKAMWHEGDEILCTYNADYSYVVAVVPGGIVYDTTRVLDAKRGPRVNFTIPDGARQIIIEGTLAGKSSVAQTLLASTEVLPRGGAGDFLNNLMFWVLLIAAAVLAGLYRPILYIPNENKPQEPDEVGGAAPVMNYERNGRNYSVFLAPFFSRKPPLNILPGTGHRTLVVMELPSKRKEVNPTTGRMFKNVYTMPLPTTKGGQQTFPTRHEYDEKRFPLMPGYNGKAWKAIFCGQPNTDSKRVEDDFNEELNDTPEERAAAKEARLHRRAEELHPQKKEPAATAPPPASPGNGS